MLEGHRQQHEGWWLAEFALALESLAWRWDLPHDMGVVCEARLSKWTEQDEAARVDLLFAPIDPETGGLKRDVGPRIWIELKTRSTAWGHPNKALLSHENPRGVSGDIDKLEKVKWKEHDAVIAALLVIHDDDEGGRQRLPEDWASAIETLAQRHKRLLKPQSVGFPFGKEAVRWASLEIYEVHVP